MWNFWRSALAFGGARSNTSRSSATLPPVQAALPARPRVLELCELEDRILFSATPVGGETLVNTTVGGAQDIQQESPQAVAGNANGDLVVVWTSADGGGKGVYAQQFDANGNAVGSEFLVNTETSGDQQNASVTMDDAGNFVITWSSNGQDGGDTEFMPSATTRPAWLRGANFSSTQQLPASSAIRRSAAIQPAILSLSGKATGRMGAAEACTGSCITRAA